MRSLIKRQLRGKIIIPLFLMAGIFYAIMMTISIPKVMSFSAGMKILDMIPTGYNAAYVNSLFITLGEEGRNTYLFNQIPLDMFYPFFLGISFCLILAYILKKLGRLEGHLFYICFLPISAALFDYCENIGIIIMLNRYPDNIDLMAQTTNIFSILKSSFTTISFIMLIILLIVLGIRKIAMKRNNTIE